ncbi:uncharacterized protein LOC110763579 isoform X2 [Prunus avium]|uniref:Uncharacterized protein LOC110763579 isoform X2 n=1 Tax=Prunus avium TaxID=42229 RepID=A0A6P5T4J6_PRUAV|nr:uncharacterized protein LOC110763579 isoform X2 [Prunus avium]
MYRSCGQHRMLTDFEGATRKNEVGFRIWTSKEFHQYQVVGRKLPMASDEHPKIYRMKLWATNEVRAKSKFWYFLRKLKRSRRAMAKCLPLMSQCCFAMGKWFLLNSPPGEIQFVAKADVKEAASEAPPQNDQSNWRLLPKIYYRNESELSPLFKKANS